MTHKCGMLDEKSLNPDSSHWLRHKLVTITLEKEFFLLLLIEEEVSKFKLDHSQLWTYFRMSVGQSEALLRMLAPQLRRQSSGSSGELTGPTDPLILRCLQHRLVSGLTNNAWH